MLVWAEHIVTGMAAIAAVIMPGLLAVLLAGERKIFWPAVVGWGLITTFFTVWGLVVAGWYTQGMAGTIAAVEAAAVIALIWWRWGEIDFYLGRREWWLIFLVMALSARRVAAAVFYPFWVGDVWASWNRWAVEWTRMAGFSGNDFTYPQVAPAAWSYIYTLAGDIYGGEYYAHAFTILFTVGVIWILSRWPAAISRTGIFIFTGYLLFNQSSFLAADVGSGLADLPVAFFALLSLYFLQAYWRGGQRGDLWRAMTAAAGAALTKQAGLFYWLVMPVLIIAGAAGGGWREKIKRIWGDGKWAMAVSAGMVLLWYGVQNVTQVATFGQITDALAGKGIGERLAAAIYITAQVLGIYLNIHTQPLALVLAVMAGVLAVVGFGFVYALLKNKFYRYLAVFFAVPYWVVWALIYSYDTRNSFIAIIPILFIAADGWGGWMEDKWPVIKEWRVGGGRRWLVGVAVLLLGVAAWRQPILYAHLRNPFIWEGVTDNIMIKKGRIWGWEGLVRAYLAEYETGGKKVLTNDGTWVSKLHLEPVATVRQFFSENGEVIEPEEIARAAEESDLIMARVGRGEYADLRRVLSGGIGSKEMRELYKDEEAGVYLLGVE